MFKKILATKPDSSIQTGTLSKRVYKLFNALLPIVLLLLIRSGLTELSIVMALFSKWRVFTVKPRHMWANLRSNAVDIIVKLSTLAFMIESSEMIWLQLVWTAWYIVWLTIVKPGWGTVLVALQAMIAQVFGLSALLYYSNTLATLPMLLLAWLVGMAVARHFIGAYEEKEAPIMSAIWGLFVLQMTWVVYKWTLVYVFIPQLVLIVVVVGYALGSMYDQHKAQKLKSGFVRQQLLVAGLVLILLLVTGNWHGAI
jgi:hypothetical protein